MRLLLDAHIDPDVAKSIRNVRPTEVVALRDWEGGTFLDAPDSALLFAAYQRGWALVTFDQRTIAPLLNEWGVSGRTHAGVVFVDDRAIAQNDVGGLVRALVALVDGMGDVSWENRQVYLRR